MKNRKFLFSLSILFLLISTSIWGLEKNNISITKINNISASDFRVRASLSAADTCSVRHDQGLILMIPGWIIGNELYKNYLDPSLTCADAYPYTVTEINMPMIFDSVITFIVSVDVEDVNYSNPNCPFPDTILGISSPHTVTIPSPGLWNIWIPLDEPVVVNGPFFAGFFIGELDATKVPFPVTDEDTLSICASYNIWDDSIGFVDLMDFGFPGRLALYASGFPGGGPTEPVPQISILTPTHNSKEYRTSEFWVDETSGSSIIEYVSFSYASDTGFFEFGRDYDGTKSFRDNVNPSINGNGYSFTWDFSTIPEGTYTIRATAVDTLGRSSTDDISIYLEPTPPVVEITTPAFGEDFCPTFDILMSSNDEDLNSVILSYKRSEPNFTTNAQTLLLSNFGNSYSSATAASLAIQALADRGDSFLMRDGFNTLTTTQMASKMIEFFDPDADSVIYDEDVLNGLRQFNISIGNSLILSHKRFPRYKDLRTQIELNGKLALAGIGGTSNHWVLISGFSGTVNLDGTYFINISNPNSAQIDTVQLREQNLFTEIFYNGNWQPIEIIISMSIYNWNSQLTTIGTDNNRSDGWAYNWTPPNLWQDNDYYIQTKGTDASAMVGYHTTMLSYDCTQFYLAGDFNNDGMANLNDLTYLVNYYTNQGAPPVGGDARADANCDGYLNITDIIYYANFIFGLAPTPCY